MRHTLMTVALCLSSFCLSANTITPQVDTIPFKSWNFGFQSSFLSDFNGITTYRLGMFSEHRINERFSIEADINLSRTDANLTEFYQYESTDLDVALSAKYRIGSDKSWFLKIGYYQIHNLWNNAAERLNDAFQSSLITYPEGLRFNIRDGLQLGVGKDFNLSHGRAISVESILRRVARKYQGGLKIGFRF